MILLIPYNHFILNNYFKRSHKFWKYLKIKFHSSLHWVVMNVVISSLYNFYVFISMLINKINIYLFFCLSKIIFSFYDAVRDFSFWNLCIQFPFRVPCYNCLFSFCSLYDRSIVVLSLFLFILIRSISFRAFHLFSYVPFLFVHSGRTWRRSNTS